MANGMSEELKQRLAAGRAAAKARREQGKEEVAPIGSSATFAAPAIQEYKGHTIEIEAPDRVMVCQDTCVRAQWYGDIAECVEKAREHIDSAVG